MKKLSNTETELKKSVAYKNSVSMYKQTHTYTYITNIYNIYIYIHIYIYIYIYIDRYEYIHVHILRAGRVYKHIFTLINSILSLNTTQKRRKNVYKLEHNLNKNKHKNLIKRISAKKLMLQVKEDL